MFIFYKKIKDRIWSNWMFFLFVITLLLLILVFDFLNFINIFNYFIQIFIKILLPLFFVYILILFLNVFRLELFFKKFIWSGSYLKRNIFSMIFGIISSGPIYLWYWLLKKLNNSGLTLGHIATFSYARAIKLPLLPIMISYFWIKYSFIFIFVLLFLSFFQWFLLDFLINKKKNQ